MTAPDAVLDAAQDLSELLGKTGKTVGRQLTALWGGVMDGWIPVDDFMALAEGLLVAANERAAAMALAEWTRTDTALTGTPPDAVPPAPRHATDTTRIATGLDTIVAASSQDTVDTAMRLARLAMGEVTQTAADARRDAIRGSGARGWTRGMEADACQLCTWWWREGRIWHPDHVMPRHTGCACVQVPVYDHGPDYTAAQLARRERERQAVEQRKISDQQRGTA